MVGFARQFQHTNRLYHTNGARADGSGIMARGWKITPQISTHLKIHFLVENFLPKILIFRLEI